MKTILKISFSHPVREQKLLRMMYVDGTKTAVIEHNLFAKISLRIVQCQVMPFFQSTVDGKFLQILEVCEEYETGHQQFVNHIRRRNLIMPLENDHFKQAST